MEWRLCGPDPDRRIAAKWGATPDSQDSKHLGAKATDRKKAALFFARTALIVTTYTFSTTTADSNLAICCRANDLIKDFEMSFGWNEFIVGNKESNIEILFSRGERDGKWIAISRCRDFLGKKCQYCARFVGEDVSHLPRPERERKFRPKLISPPFPYIPLRRRCNNNALDDYIWHHSASARADERHFISRGFSKAQAW